MYVILTSKLFKSSYLNRIMFKFWSLYSFSILTKFEKTCLVFIKYINFNITNFNFKRVCLYVFYLYRIFSFASVKSCVFEKIKRKEWNEKSEVPTWLWLDRARFRRFNPSPISKIVAFPNNNNNHKYSMPNLFTKALPKPRHSFILLAKSAF